MANMATVSPIESRGRAPRCATLLAPASATGFSARYHVHSPLHTARLLLLGEHSAVLLQHLCTMRDVCKHLRQTTLNCLGRWTVFLLQCRERNGLVDNAIRDSVLEFQICVHAVGRLVAIFA